MVSFQGTPACRSFSGPTRWGAIRMARGEVAGSVCARVGPDTGEGLGSLVEVVLDGRLHVVRVASRAQRLHERCVPLGDGATVDARRGDGDVGAQERLQGPPDPLEGGVAGEVHDVAVEGRVGGGLGVGVAGLGRADASGRRSPRVRRGPSR